MGHPPAALQKKQKTHAHRRAWGTRKGQRWVTRETTPGSGDVGGKAASSRRTPKRQKTHAQKTSMGHPQRQKTEAQQVPHTAGMRPVRNDRVKKKRGESKSPTLRKKRSGWGTRKGKAASSRRTPKKQKPHAHKTRMGHPKRPTMGDARDNAKERRRRRQSGVETPYSKKKADSLPAAGGRGPSFLRVNK